MKIAVDGFEFDFQDAIDAFVFDEKDRSSPTYHGLSHAMILLLGILHFGTPSEVSATFQTK